MPAILEALAQRDAEHRRVVAALAAAERSSLERLLLKPAELRARLRGLLADWHDLVSADAGEARAVLDKVLVERIRFTPHALARRYQLTIPFAFDRVLWCVLPADVGTLQETVASPTGFEPVFWP